MKRYVSNYVLCPFYHNEDPLIIYCEGVEEGTVLHIAFLEKTRKQEYKKKFCCSDKYKKCRLCSMLNNKYE